MKKIFILILFTLLSCNLYAQQVGQLIRGVAPNGTTLPIKVDSTGKLDIVGGSSGTGSVNNLASDSDGNLFMHIASQTGILNVNIATGALQMVNPVGTFTKGMVVEIATNNPTIPVKDMNMLEYGIVSEGIRQISTSTPFSISDITSGTTAPFWLTLRNIGDKTIHYSNATPSNNSDGIAAGEQVIFKYATNTPILKLQANSTGISSLAHNIWK